MCCIWYSQLLPYYGYYFTDIIMELNYGQGRKRKKAHSHSQLYPKADSTLALIKKKVKAVWKCTLMGKTKIHYDAYIFLEVLLTGFSSTKKVCRLKVPLKFMKIWRGESYGPQSLRKMGFFIFKIILR